MFWSEMLVLFVYLFIYSFVFGHGGSKVRKHVLNLQLVMRLREVGRVCLGGSGSGAKGGGH